MGLNGWLATANYDINHWLGAEGDFNGAYGSKSLGTAALLLNSVPSTINSRMHNFDFGPRVTWRPSSGKYDAFGHLLFGVSHTNLSATGSSNGDTSFSWVLGAAGDYYFFNHLGARLQLDLLRTNFFNTGANHGRVALGLAYRFGSR